MTLALDRTILLWDPKDPTRLGVDPGTFEALGMQTLCVPYDRLGGDDTVIERIEGSGSEAVVFTRNDDMDGNPPIGPLLARTAMGYTTISAIDPEHQEEQTRACTADFLNQRGIVDLPDLPRERGADRAAPGNGTFSLIFDMEQVGGVRFGLPRILKHIEPLGIRGTFFVTGFIASIYPEVIQRLVAAGHEIALHGNMHEFFTGRSYEDQLHRLSHHLEQMGSFTPIRGANLIYRMDSVTVRAMAAVGISYFVLFRKHHFYRSRYLRPSTRPRRMRTDESREDLILFPVSAETYQGDFREIKAATESAWATALKEGTRHVSILMHPFKDGSLKRMDLTRGIVQYLSKGLGLTSVTLAQCPAPRPLPQTAVRMLYRWDGCPRVEGPGPVSAGTRYWWQPLEYHALRVERLADNLSKAGSPVVLSAAASEGAPVVTVFPEMGAGPFTAVKRDPLCFPMRTARLVARLTARGRNVEVHPPAPMIDTADLVLFHLPRTLGELAVVPGKIVRRLQGFMLSLFDRQAKDSSGPARP